jgi:phage protein D
MSRIISIELNDNRGFEADELTITLDDEDGAVNIPPMDAIIEVAIGYKETGLVEKGIFKMNDFTHSGAPDQLSITARSADMAETLTEQKEKSWHKQTVGQIVTTIAKAHGYEAKVAKVYQDEMIDHIDQSNESDASFLSRLAEQFDAIATIKQNTLLFMPTGQATTVSGKPLPIATITRLVGDNHSFSYSSSNAYNAVKAFYTDKKTGKRQEVIISKDNVQPEKKTVVVPPRTSAAGKNKRRRRPAKKKAPKTKTVLKHNPIKADGLKIKTLRHLYSSEANAWRGARAAFKRIKRGTAQFTIDLAFGRADLTPESPVTVQGFKPEIDGEEWLIKKISHTMNAGSGYTCKLDLESKLSFDEKEENADEST